QYTQQDARHRACKSEHPTAPQPTARLFASYPDVNKYSESNNLSAVKKEYNHINHLEKFNYRNGLGKPEGLVAHQTANSSSTISGEINWMSSNHRNAFVHAFVDGSRII